MIRRLALLAILLFVSCSALKSGFELSKHLRVKRQTGGPNTSILTVQWEGIQSKTDDGVIKGFRVEYRPEHGTDWIEHEGLIPYRGPYYQYRVTIKDLPSGMTYYVRIKVIGQDNQVLVSTGEIRAETQTVGIDCTGGEITEPRNLQVSQTSEYSLSFRWETPECGGTNIVYEIELKGESQQFELHRIRTDSPQAQITSLLPGTVYTVRVRAIDRSTQQPGPWSQKRLASNTKGTAPGESRNIKDVYRDSKALRIEWDKYPDDKVQYYEVMILEKTGRDGEAKQLHRKQVKAQETSYLFTGLEPGKTYIIGVIAFVDSTPRQVYKLTSSTLQRASATWSTKPSVSKSGIGKFSVFWQTPTQYAARGAKYFVVEYKMPNETQWRRYGDRIPYKSGQSKYEVRIDGLDDRVFYEIRLLVVNARDETIAKTEKFSVGEGASGSCSGNAGVPTDSQIEYVTDRTITFRWQKPTCDESFGPIEAYEYLCWNVDTSSESATQPRVATGSRASIDGLQPASRYAIRIRSRTRAGVSPWSDVLQAVTKQQQTPTRLNIHEQQTQYPRSESGPGGSGAYNLRVILSTPRSYLAWTPLEEHAGNIRKFRLSYKLANQRDWIRVEQPTTYFQCPPNIASSHDYCYDLSSFKRSVQYTGQVIYQLSNGEWTQAGNPLFFILVEAERPNIPVAPNGLQVEFKTPTIVTLTWLPPLFDQVPVDHYKVQANILSSEDPTVRVGHSENFRVSGNIYTYTITGLKVDTLYNMSVAAGTKEGFLGPAAWKTVSTGKGSLNPTIEGLDVSQRGHIVHMNWGVSGDLRHLCCFQIDVRSDKDGEWRPNGNLIIIKPSQSRYETDVYNLEGNQRYFVRIKILDRSRMPVHTSDAVSVTTQCQAPERPPTNVEIRSEGSRSVHFQWTPPPRSTWNCDRVSYVIVGTAGTENVQIRVPSQPRDFRVEHRADSKPGTEWRVRVATEASGGVSPYSDEVYATTDSETAADGAQRRKRSPQQLIDNDTFCSPNPVTGTWICKQRKREREQPSPPTPSPTLVSGPRVAPQGSDLKVEWQSQGQAANIYGYRVEFRTPTGRWTPYGNMIPYTGEKPYSQILAGLPTGEMYYVRIQVLDRTQNIMFTSPVATAKTVCAAPREPPRNLRVSAPDPTHVRVTWELPPEQTWNCNDVEVELEVIEPSRGIPSRRFNSQQSTHVFDGQPNERWSVRVRTVSSGGRSHWSSAMGVRTSPAGELIINLRSMLDRGKPVVSWQSIQGVQDLVSHYIVYYSFDGRDWTALPNGKVRYAGDRHPYVVQLENLPDGRTIFVRVKVIDYNNGEAFVSAPISVEMPAKCQRPAGPPSSLTAQSTGTTQIRVAWRPLERAQWNCDHVWYLLKFSSPQSEGVKNLTSRESSFSFQSDPFTQWSFRILAENQAGRTGWSNLVQGTTLEGQPSEVRGLRYYQLGPSVVQLSWSAPENPNGRVRSYEVTYQLLSKGMCSNQPDRTVTVNTNSPQATSYQLEGLHPHSKYRVTVAAKTNVVGSPAQLEFTTDTQVPTAPPRSIIARSNDPRSVSLTWQAPSCLDSNGDITEYEYELKGVDAWATGEVHQKSQRGTSAKVPGLTPYTTYKLRVRAYTSKGPGPWSVEQTVRTRAANRPGAPPNLQVVDTSPVTVTLMWEAPYPPMGELDLYKVRYTLAGKRQWSDREFPASGLHCNRGVLTAQRVYDQNKRYMCATIDLLQQEQLYEFQVAAHMAGREWGPWSNTQTAQTGSGPVQVLAVDKVGGDSSSLEIKWAVRPSDRPRVIGFKIVSYPVSAEHRVQEYMVDGSTYRYRIENLEANTDYNVSVEARTKSGYHPPGRSMVFHTDDMTVPAMLYPPRLTEAEATTLTFEWNAPLDARAVRFYELEYRSRPDQAWRSHERVRHVPGQRSFQSTIRGQQPNSEIEVRVKAIGDRDRHGEPSASTRARTECDRPRDPPQNARVDSPSSTEVRVTWMRPGRETWGCDHVDYELWYQVSGEQPRTVPISSEQTEYTLTANPHTTWMLKLRTKNQVGHSDWTSPLQITTQQDRPGKVRNLILDPRSPNTVYAAWREPIDKQGVIVGYDVSYRLKYRVACPDEEPRDVTQEWITVYNVKDNDYLITGLLPNAEYEVRVQARTTELGEATTKSVRTAATPPSAPPLDLKLTYALERSLSFSWQPVECSQRHGIIGNYEYELMGLDVWAKLQRQIANTTQLTVDLDGLIPYTKYVMRVKAYNSAGGGPNTENLEVQTAPAEAPLAPQDLVVMQEGISFFATSWVPPYPPYGPLEKYKIRYRKISFTGEKDWITYEHDANDPRFDCRSEKPTFRVCYNITGQNPGEQFRVQVAAKIENGEYGPWCEAIIAKTLEIVPDAPQSIGLKEKSDNMLTVWWEGPRDMPERVTQYKVSVRPCDAPPNGDAKSWMVDGNVFEYSIRDLDPETCYNVTVQAGTSRGFGPGRSTQMTTDPFEVPAVQTQPTVTPYGADTLNVEWPGVVDPSSRIEGYILEFRRADVPTWQPFGSLVPHDAVKRTYFEKISGLEADTTYLVRIKVVDKKNRESEPSPEAQARTGCSAPLQPPSSPRLDAPSANELKMTWVEPPPYTWMCSSIRYHLEYKNGSLGVWEQEKHAGSTTEATYISKPYTNWMMRIRTENEAGQSAFSEEVSITTPQGAPGPVTNPDGRETGPESVVVTWGKPVEPNGELKGYTVIYRKVSKGSCKVQSGQPIVKQVMSEKIDIDDLEPDTTYEIVVKARTIHEGPASQPIRVTTDEARPSGAPERVRVVTVNRDRVDLDWQPPNCDQRNGQITQYSWELEGRDKWLTSPDDIMKTGSSRLERTEIDGLVPYTNYRFRVRAHTQKGDGPESDWVDFQTRPGPPPAPRDLGADKVQPSAVKISFLPPSPPHGEVDEYRIRHTVAGRVSWREVRLPPQELTCADLSSRLCYRIGDLEPEEEYEIQVAAHTRDGDWGEWTKSLPAKTPEIVIPALDSHLRVTEQKPDSLTLTFEGLPPEKTKNVDGYRLECNEQGGEWTQQGKLIPLKQTHEGNMHTVKVVNLKADTPYFCRIRVGAKNGKFGPPGPEDRVETSCGRPLQAPHGVRLHSDDFRTIKVTYEEPVRSTWQCSHVVYVLHYKNNTHEDYVDIATHAPRHYSFETVPGTTWTVRMKTQALEDGVTKSHSSDWSPEDSLTIRVPGDIYLDITPKGPAELESHWELPPEDKNWQYGTDVTYVLRQEGNCDMNVQHNPITKYNVQGNTLMLKNLKPFSLYDVQVKPRAPTAAVETPTTSQEARTQEMAPNGPPTNVRNEDVARESLLFRWEPPECDKQRGEITQYEYSLQGLDPWAEKTKLQAVTTRDRVILQDLHPGTQYQFKVRAYTKIGAGPWSDPIKVRTAGSEIGAPRELHPVSTGTLHAVLTWLPPYPLRGAVTGYKLAYSTEQETVKPNIVDLRTEDLSCNKYKDPMITHESRCFKLEGLQPETAYVMKVQARAESGNWGEWSLPVYLNTKATPPPLGGSLHAKSRTHDSIAVKWVAPGVIEQDIEYYTVSASLPNERPGDIKVHNVSRDTTDFDFKNLKPVTTYNVTVEGVKGGRMLWFAAKEFATTDLVPGPLDWLTAPSNLRLIEKSHTMMHVEWDPPEILLPRYRELLTHYKVTIAPYNHHTGVTGTPQEFTIDVPGTRIRWDDRNPETVYNITVEACTRNGCGAKLWGAYSTLPYPGRPHILRLVYRTPFSLRVGWTPVWGENSAYTLVARPLHSLEPGINMEKVHTRDVPPGLTEYTIHDLHPATIYNVTLRPTNRAGGAWGAYNTLPPGALVVRNLRSCQVTDWAISVSWDALVIGSDNENRDGTSQVLEATKYKVRYTKENLDQWIERPEQSTYEHRCPGDPCDKKCYLIYNLDRYASEYTVQVSAFIDGMWHRWKTVAMNAPADPNPLREKACCIVAPDYYLDTLHDPGTIREIIVKPVPNDTNLLRYYVVADTRPERGDINASLLTDMLTAKRRGIPYYVTGSFDRNTLTAERKFPVGDGKVYGGYLNYPMEKGVNYDFPFVAVWWFDNKPLVGWWRDSRGLMVAGWPWWWLLLLLLLLLLLILLCCCCYWIWASRYRRRAGRRVVGNGTHAPLLGTMSSIGEVSMAAADYTDNRVHMSSDQSETRSSRHRRSAGYYDAADNSYYMNGGVVPPLPPVRDSSRYYDYFRYYDLWRSKGDFEDGYVRGFRDSSKVGSAEGARARMEGYGEREGNWHSGYVQGLRDAGTTGMSTSMHNLAARNQSGYSSGYMQGFRDGNSGIFGDRITTTLLNRLEEQYPNQDDFRQGYIEGFKDGTGSRTEIIREDKQLHESFNKISERLETLERQKGEEVHQTKIYHVYNQTPDGSMTAGQQLAYELDESRKGTMRRHYTPGDYLRYGTGTTSDMEGYGSSLRRGRRSLSATALGRDAELDRTSVQSSTLRTPRYGVGSIARTPQYGTQDSSYVARRYNYRSRSDLGTNNTSGRRLYGSTTILDGTRPGPTAPSWRRDALESLQRELDTISRSPTSPPVGGGPGLAPDRPMAPASRRDAARGGYSSDTGYLNDTWRSGRDYESYQTEEHKSVRQQQQSSRTQYGGTQHAITATPISSRNYRVSAASAQSPTSPEASSTSSGRHATATTDQSGGGALAAAYNLVGLSNGAAGGAQQSLPTYQTRQQPSTSAVQSHTSTQQSSERRQQIMMEQGSSAQQQQQVQHEWPDNLMDIVQEPMGQTLDRMKKYSNSMGQVQPAENQPLMSSSGTAADGSNVKETVSESYQASYREEFTTQP